MPFMIIHLSMLSSDSICIFYNFPGFFQNFFIFFYFPGLSRPGNSFFIFQVFFEFWGILNLSTRLSVFIYTAFRTIIRITEPHFEQRNSLLRNKARTPTMFCFYDVTKQYGRTSPERLTFSPIEDSFSALN